MVGSEEAELPVQERTGIAMSKADVDRLRKELPRVKIEWTEPNESYLKRIRALFGDE